MCNKDLSRSTLPADMSTDSRPTCRPSTDRYVGRLIGWYSIDMSADWRSTGRLVCRSALGRHLGRYVWIDCRGCISRLSVVSEYCSRLFSWNSFHLLAHRGRERRYITYSRVLTGQDAAQTAAKSNTYLIAVLYSREFAFVRVELQSFLNKGLPSRVLKVRSCKIAIDHGIDRIQNF